MSNNSLRTAIARAISPDWWSDGIAVENREVKQEISLQQADAVLAVLADQPAKVVERMRENRPTTPPPGYATGSDAADVRRRELQMTQERCEEMTTDRIDHAARARKYSDKALHPSTGSPEVGLVYAQLSNAEATLALVEQQRIANLIALSDGDWDHGQAIDALVVRPQTGVDPYPLRPEIAAALGIETGDDNE